MLVRAFRVTDRLSNAVLRIGAWSAMVMVDQAAHLKNGLFGILITFWMATAGTVLTAQSVARQTSQTAQGVSQEVAARRQQRMAQRAAEAELKPTIIKDPLLAQNRALSAFAVLLLLVLLTVMVVQSTDDGNDPLTSGGGGRWPDARSTAPATALFPTAIPTATPVPDPLRVGGSIVYTLRENGQEDLWAIAVGENSPPLRLTNSPADERDPAWSPDGTRIAFASNRDGNWELYIMQVDTGQITRLTYSQGFEGAPTWSPDSVWLAYEGYYQESQDLDIYLISTDPARAASEGAQRVTTTPGPDIEPDWGPDGRHIAYVSWRTGNQEIFIISLDEGDTLAVNLTNTPDIHEDYPTWSHSGVNIAYSANVDGVEGVWIKPAQQIDSTNKLIGKGRMPAWAPNDGSVVYALDHDRQTQLLAGTIGQFGAATDAIALPSLATDPHWTQTVLPGPLVASGGLPPSAETAQALYIENEQIQSTGLYGMALLDNVNVPQPYLSDRVNDSFEAMRRRTLTKAGYDFFGTLEEAFWYQDRPVDPGEPRENWHYTGRAISIDRNLVYAGVPTPVEVVREDIEVNTYWRVYLRVTDAAQNGALGEPLRRMPWDLAARSSGDVEDYERGGRLKDRIPTGYYIDLTQLAEDFGWERLPAQRTWQYNFAAIQYWEFVKSDGLNWDTAMLELYDQQDFAGFLSEATRIPAPPPLPTESPTPEIFRSPTPLPPDLQS
ncbi:MAG: PD40 domain-containing protein [Chloroflexi bacterium]|nr:PD40 domain-containing protein [Chloroflexota bacterium]